MTQLFDDTLDIKEQTAAEKAIITSALNLFIIHHEDTISVTQLIKAAGTTKSNFYKYFSSKEDVYAAILLTDELALTPILKDLRVYGSVADLLQQYLKFRIQHIDKYRVLVRLERHLLEKNKDLQRLDQWQAMRRRHVDEFTAIVEAKTSRFKPVDRENIRFYYGLVWSIASGVAALSESDFFHELILDRRGFTRFLLESVGNIGDDK